MWYNPDQTFTPFVALSMIALAALMVGVMFIAGALTPIESMPAFLQNLSRLSPLTHYMEVILGIFLKGAGFAELWPHALALLAIGLPLFGLSLAAFRTTLT